MRRNIYQLNKRDADYRYFIGL